MALDFKYLTPDQQLTALFKSIGIPERRKVKVKIDFDLIEAKRLYHAWFLASNPKLKNPNSEGPYIVMTEDSCEILRKLKTAINTAINIEEKCQINKEDEKLLEWGRAREKAINVLEFLENLQKTTPADNVTKQAREIFEYIVNLRNNKMSNEKLENEPEIISVNLPENLPPDVMRLNEKPLSDIAADRVYKIKKMGNNFHEYLESFPNNRELSLAKAKLEEFVMWAVKGISA